MTRKKSPPIHEPPGTFPGSDGLEFNVSFPVGWVLESLAFTKQIGTYVLMLSNKNGFWIASLTDGDVSCSGSWRPSAGDSLRSLRHFLKASPATRELANLCN